MANWQIHLLYVAIGAIVLAIVLFVAFRKGAQYKEEARVNFKALIRMPTGRPLKFIVKPTPDGWVRLGRLGDYKLPSEMGICECGHSDQEHEFDIKEGRDIREDTVRGKCTHDSCSCTEFKLKRVLPAIREWSPYPDRPFLGIPNLQTEIRTQDWYLGNPEPITPPDRRIVVTAVDAAMHTREMDAQNVGVRIQGLETQQKTILDALNKIPNAAVLYVMLGAAVLIPVINFVRSLSL